MTRPHLIRLRNAERTEPADAGRGRGVTAGRAGLGSGAEEDGRLLALAPLRAEALALRWGAPALRIERCGMGVSRARRAARWLGTTPAGALVVAGLGGALDRRLAPGDIVVASELRLASGERRPIRAPGLAELLRTLGHRIVVGPIVSSERLVIGSERERLEAGGARLVDTESWWLAEGAGARSFGVVRVVVDTPGHELFRPGTALRGLHALRVLARLAPALAAWGGQIPTSSETTRPVPRPAPRPVLESVSRSA